MPIVAIVGRPNVGKSTLFNKLIGKRKAITTDEMGVTRDLNYGEVETGTTGFTLIDTGGFDPYLKDDIALRVREQVEFAIDEADLIVCLMDGRSGLTPLDREMVDRLRATAKPVIYGINKIDTPKQEPLLLDFMELGVAPIIPISAEHSIGLDRLIDEIEARIPEGKDKTEIEDETRIAIVGRPNVGKSTLVNRILGFERVIVTPIPGTTRDVVDTPFRRGDKAYRIIDTAGIRRRSRISKRLEVYSVLRAIRSIDSSDVVILMVDATEGVTSQDARLGGLISRRGKGCIIAVNKWDLIKKDTYTMRGYEEKIRQSLKFLNYAPIVFISAMTGKRVDRIFDFIDSVSMEINTRVPTSRLNRLVECKLSKAPLPTYKGKPIRIFYITQVGINPPSFVAFVNHPEGIKEQQKRFFVNTLREGLGLRFAPIRLWIKKKS